MVVTQLLVVKGMEAPSTNTKHGEYKDTLKDSKKKEKELELELKNETNMGECSYNRMQIIVYVEEKVDHQPICRRN
jgi:hypothetical protein